MEEKKLKTLTSPFFQGEEIIGMLGESGSFIKEVYYPTRKHPRFHADRLLIGRSEEGEVWLPANEAFRALILGATRSGKSFLSERILTVAFKGGNKVCILADVKNEFFTLAKPLQGKFVRGLAKDEEPLGMPIKIYRPQFLIKNDGHNLPKNIPAQISFQDCSFSDLVTLLGIEKSEMLRGVVGMIYDEIRSGKITNFEEFGDAVMDLEKVSSIHKRSLLAKLIPLKKFEVIGNNHPFSFVDDIMEGYIPILNMSGFEDLGRDFSSFPQAYVAVVLRQLLRAKRKEIIDKRLYIFLDELPRFCPKYSDPTSKVEIMEAVDLVGGKGINFIFAAQDTSNLPDSILNQSRFTFLPYNSSRPLIEAVMRNKGIWRWSPTFANEIMNQFKKLRKFYWVLIDSNTVREVDELYPLESTIKFRSYSPLAMHKETEGKK
jgi:hypothetical protein